MHGRPPLLYCDLVGWLTELSKSYGLISESTKMLQTILEIETYS